MTARQARRDERDRAGEIMLRALRKNVERLRARTAPPFRDLEDWIVTALQSPEGNPARLGAEAARDMMAAIAIAEIAGVLP